MFKKLTKKWNAWVRSIKNRAWALWAKAAGIRAVKTVAQALIANVGVAAAMSLEDWLAALSAAALAGIASLAMSLVGIPEVDAAGDSRSWFNSAMARSARTIGQSVASSLAAYTLLSEVHWPAVLAAALVAGALSIVTSLAGLPEAESDNKASRR